MKKLLYSLLVITLFVPIILFGVLLFVLSKPEYYQNELQTVFASKTGLNIEVGNIGWRYWPPIALKVGTVKIRNPASTEVIAELGSAEVDIDLLPLLMGDSQLQIKGVSVDGLNLTLKVDKFGNENWSQVTTGSVPSDQQTTPAAKNEKSGVLALMPFGITQLQVSNSVINYQDDRVMQNFTVTLTEFSTNSVDYDAPFPVAFNINLLDITQKIGLESIGALTITLDSKTDLVSISNIVVDGGLSLPEAEILKTSLRGEIDLDLGNDTLTLSNIKLGLSDLTANLTLLVEDVMKGPSSMKGGIAVDPFNAKKLLREFNIADLEFQNPKAFESLQLSMNFKTDMVRYETKDLSLKLDGTTITGSSSISLLSRPEINLNFEVDDIDLSSYSALPTLEFSGAGANTSGAVAEISATKVEDSEVIPRDLIKDNTINAHLLFNKVRYDDLEASAMKLYASTKSNRMEATLDGTLYGGTLALKFADNPDDLETSGYNTIKMKGVDVTGLTGFEWITGTLNLTSNIEFAGSRLSEILSSLNGPSRFVIRDGTLDVTPIKGVAKIIEQVQGKPSTISTWPDKVPFKTLEGNHNFSNGQHSQNFDFRVENLSVDGLGYLDYLKNHLQYDMSAVISQSRNGQFQVSPNLIDVRWPITCKGKLDDSPVDMCRPKSDTVKDLVRGMVKKKIKTKVKTKVEEKLKDKLKDRLRGRF